MTIIIKAGKCYRKEFGTIAEIGARVGDVVEGTSDGCGAKYVKTISSIGPLRVEYEDGGYDTLDAEGFRIICRASDVTPKQPGPVVTETITRKRIVPGVYGDVVVWNDGTGNVSMMDCNTVKGLTAAIATLTAIRDAMQEAKP
jgi:hypothetical protein